MPILKAQQKPTPEPKQPQQEAKREMTAGERRTLVAALMTVMFLGAMDVTVVSIASPRIAADLSGYNIMSFLFSAYTLTSSVTIPIYGKLADLFGRKRVLMFGIVVFLIGSAVCGLSLNMPTLIVGRGIQGIGFGAIFTLVNTIIGDVFPLEQRGRVMGAVGSVWGIASLVGPFVGGLMIDFLNWHWIFGINIPLGLIALILLGFSFKESFVPRRAPFDFAGAVTLALTITLLLIAFDAASLPIRIATGGLAAICLIAFILVEKRAREPIVPHNVTSKMSVMINLATLLAAAVMMGSSIYMPIFMQNVLGYSATVSGLLWLPQSLTWLVMSFTLSAVLIRRGTRWTMVFTSALMLAAYALYCLFTATSPIWMVAIFIAFSGFGLGGVLNATLLVIQETSAETDRGATVAFNQMIKSIAQALGAGLYGGIFNMQMSRALTAHGATEVNLGNPFDSLVAGTSSGAGASSGAGVPIAHAEAVAAFADSLHVIFILLAVFSLVVLIFGALTPQVKLGRKN
jgi:EmrB/QacA subfamily drug resistance transporter